MPKDTQRQFTLELRFRGGKKRTAHVKAAVLKAARQLLSAARAIDADAEATVYAYKGKKQ